MRYVARCLLLVFLALLPVVTATAQSTPTSDATPPLPFGSGIGSTATYLDQRGNSILSITITGIERNWAGYSRYSEPQAGMEYVLVHVSVTNETGRPFILEPYDFTLVDSLGESTDRAWVSDDPTHFSQDTTIGAGETVEGGLVFEMFTDLDPLLMIYEPNYGIYVVIYLGE